MPMPKVPGVNSFSWTPASVFWSAWSLWTWTTLSACPVISFNEPSPSTSASSSTLQLDGRSWEETGSRLSSDELVLICKQQNIFANRSGHWSDHWLLTNEPWILNAIFHISAKHTHKHANDIGHEANAFKCKKHHTLTGVIFKPFWHVIDISVVLDNCKLVD